MRNGQLTTASDEPWLIQARELLVLALPIIGMTVTRMLMGFIDFAMVSRLGTEAQAAISPASLLVFAIACMGAGIAQAVQTYVAQVDGRGEPRQAGGYAWQSVYLAAASTLLVVPLFLTLDQWFGWLANLGRHEPAVRELEVAYVRIALWFVPAAVLAHGLDGFYAGIRKPRIILIAALAGLATNALGNWLLIFGPTFRTPAVSIPLLGTLPALSLEFPALGIAGAAIATVVGWTVRAAILWATLLSRNYAERFNTRRSFPPDLSRLRSLVRIGGPTSVQWMIDLGSWIVFMLVMVPPFGKQAMAASNVAIQLMHFSFMPAIGLGIALCSQVGYAIGQGQPGRAVQRTRVAVAVTMLYMGAAGLVFLFARRELVWLFNDDPEVIEAGAWVLIWAAIFQIFDAMGITFINALRGAGDTRWPAVVTFVLCWGVFVGGGVLVSRTAPQLGLNGPWATCTSYIVLLGILLAWRWRSGTWRKIRLFKPGPVSVGESAAVSAAAGPVDL